MGFVSFKMPTKILKRTLGVFGFLFIVFMLFACSESGSSTTYYFQTDNVSKGFARSSCANNTLNNCYVQAMSYKTENFYSEMGLKASKIDKYMKETLQLTEQKIESVWAAVDKEGETYQVFDTIYVYVREE